MEGEEERAMDVDESQQNSQTEAGAGEPSRQEEQSQTPPMWSLGGSDGEDDKDVPGTYNPADYSNLQVSAEVKELFEYIQRYKPQKIDLDTKLKPFIPDYVPAVGEVDACLKMPKPDGQKEDLGIT